MKEITVLSLFNGCEGASMALGEAGIPVNKMYASEIDKFANKAAQLLFPDTIHLGDITKWDTWEDDYGVDFSDVDLLMAGFPCQAWSMAGKQKGDNDPRGALVHDLLDIWGYIKTLNPKLKIMFENVAMKKEFMDYINNLFGVKPVMINAALVTAQNRKRNYWMNWEVNQPEDLGILLKDIIEGGTAEREKPLCVTTRIAGATEKRYLEKSQRQMVIMSDTFAERQKGRKCLVDEPKDKAANLSAMEYVKNGRQGDYIQCDKDGNQTVFRPCELRVTKKPLEFKDWADVNYPNGELGKALGQPWLMSEDDLQVEYAKYYESVVNSGVSSSALCHHVATATDIKANESNKRIYADTGKSPTLTTMGGGHREPKVFIGAVRGRYIVDGKRADHKVSSQKGITEQRLEINHSEKSNCLTTVQKDNVVVIDPPKYRKLTPKECMRLQGFPSWCIDKLLESGISNSQLYKMTGNGFAIPVITHNLKSLLATGWMSE